MYINAKAMANNDIDYICLGLDLYGLQITYYAFEQCLCTNCTPLCPIMLLKLVKFPLPESEYKFISLTTCYKAIESIELKATCQFAYWYSAKFWQRKTLANLGKVVL